MAAMGKSNGLEDNNSPDDIKGTGHSCSRTLRFYHFYLPGGEKRSSTIGDFALPVVPFLDRSELINQAIQAIQAAGGFNRHAHPDDDF